MKLVNRNWAVRPAMATMSASVNPAARTSARSSSLTLPRVSAMALAKRTAAARFEGRPGLGWRLG
jgi:hypothetical protein